MSVISPSSSLTSVEDMNAAVARRHIGPSKKRFSHAQTMMLENMYKHNSRPSRQERETLSKAGQIDIKSVTIWFQNKRQSERKVARAALEGSHHQQQQQRERRGSGHKRKHSSSPGSHHSSASRLTPVSPRHVPLPPTPPVVFSSSFPPAIRPSLEQVASRSELAQSPSEPQTPRKRDPRMPIWECMPASPPIPVESPPAREFVEFGKLKRSITLEWACARRRMAEKEGGATMPDEEEEEDDEVDRIMQEKARAKAQPAHRQPHHTHTRGGSASIPTQTKRKLERSMTWDMGDVRRSAKRANNSTPLVPSGLRRTESHSHHHHPTTPATPEDDDDIMRAALALCGLGRGRGEA
ncbi:hypothetical protein PM082_001206 [Marasmius tenuissimus]|nr:hypothetical protein PM082_001206 [Marasmius tenuissimus]